MALPKQGPDAGGGSSQAVMAVAAVMLAVSAAQFAVERFTPVDEPLPVLPAKTLAGESLDTAYFGDRPWVILVWLPG